MGELILDRIGCAIVRGHLRLAQANLRWRLMIEGEHEVRDTLAQVDQALGLLETAEEER